LYSGGAARAQDAYDVTMSNGSFAKASNITSLIDTTTKTAVINNLDLTTASDLDFYKFVVPTGAASTLKVQVQSQGLSLLNPTVKILNQAGTVVATAKGSAYGTTVTATVSGIAAGKTYYVEVLSNDAIGAFKTGKYALMVNMGTGANPTATLPD